MPDASAVTGPPVFTCWIVFTTVFSLCNVESLSLLNISFLYLDLYVLGDNSFIS